MNIRTYNNIAPSGVARLQQSGYTVAADTDHPVAILLRSHCLLETQIDAGVVAVARAGAGVNNIPLAHCSQRGIAVFNTPGANANSVKELVLAAMLLASRPLLQAHRWGQEHVGDADFEHLIEANKKLFVGSELHGKRLGVLGLGAIGSAVANMAVQLGLDVMGYDPYLSVEAAWQISRQVQRANALDDFSECDLLTVHAPLLDSTRGMIGEALLAKMKPGLKLINLARAGLVHNQSVLNALERGQLAAYVTDFPSPELLAHPRVIAFPHLGASTGEAEENCALMAATQLRDFLQHGSVRNAVNLPSCSLARQGEEGCRLTVFTRNVPNMIGQVSTVLANAGLNIAEMVNQHRGELAYNIIDTSLGVTEETLALIAAIKGVLRVRLLPSVRG